NCHDLTSARECGKSFRLFLHRNLAHNVLVLTSDDRWKGCTNGKNTPGEQVDWRRAAYDGLLPGRGPAAEIDLCRRPEQVAGRGLAGLAGSERVWRLSPFVYRRPRVHGLVR